MISVTEHPVLPFLRTTTFPVVACSMIAQLTACSLLVVTRRRS
jgi:hypothetical protein